MHLIRVLNEAEPVCGFSCIPGMECNHRWASRRVRGQGAIVRLECSILPLSKEALYSNPIDRNILASSLDPEWVEQLVLSYLTHALGQAKRQSLWTKSEILAFNQSINWDTWCCPTVE